jgi:hypothetical protein
MKKILFTLSAFVLVLTSCDKEEDEPALTMDMIAGTYTLVSMKMKAGSNPEVDVTSYLDNCEKDDTQTFAANGVYTYTDAGVQCSPSVNATSTWSLPNVTTLILDGQSMTIKSFDGDKLELSETYTDMGTTYTRTMMLDKQ